MFKIGTKKCSSGKAESFGGKHKIQDRWENVPYVVMDKPYPDVLVYKVRSGKCDDKPRVFYQNLLFPLLNVQQNKSERDQEKS